MSLRDKAERDKLRVTMSWWPSPREAVRKALEALDACDELERERDEQIRKAYNAGLATTSVEQAKEYLVVAKERDAARDAALDALVDCESHFRHSLNGSTDEEGWAALRQAQKFLRAAGRLKCRLGRSSSRTLRRGRRYLSP